MNNDEYIKELKEQRNALLINEIEKDQYIQELKEQIYTLHMNVIEKDKYIEQLKEQLNIAAGILFRLEKYGYINTYDDDDESQVDHFRDIGRQVVKNARRLLDIEPDKSSIKPDKSIDGSLIWKLKKTIDHGC